MTVAELIDKLKECPQDSKVLTRLNFKKGDYEEIKLIEIAKMNNFAFDYGDYSIFDEEDDEGDSTNTFQAVLLDTGTSYD